MKEAGFEIASHGLRWIDYQDTCAGGRRRRYIDAAIRFQPRSPARGRSAFTRDDRRSTPSRWRWGGRLRLSRRQLRRRSALLARRAAWAAARRALYARRQRHALRDAAGLQLGDQFFAYLKDTLDTLHARGHRMRPHDVGRAALPAGRPAGTRGGAGALRRLRARQGRCVAGAPHRHRPALDRPPSVRRTVQAEPHAARAVPGALRPCFRAHAEHRRGGASGRAFAAP